MRSNASFGHVINGVVVQGTGPRIDVINPADESVVGSVPEGTPSDVDEAVASAAAAFETWSVTPVATRAKVVRAISAGIEARSAELAELITAEMGSPITFATKVQTSLPVATSAGVADILENEFSFSEEIGNSLVLREAIGVVGAITPWNYPLHQVVAKVVPALAAGCSVVLKPSEIAPMSAMVFAEICHEAGLPAGVLNVVHGSGKVVGEAISSHEDISMVSFTGSTAAGKLVSVAAAATVKRVALELGGKSASVLLDDADFDVAVKLAVGDCFINSGQTCSALTRMLVPEDRLDEVIDKAVQAAAKYTVGDPTDQKTRIGPMASRSQQERVEGYITKGVAEGARRVYGESVDIPSTGCYVAPTVFADVTTEMTIAQEEIFGPVLAIMTFVDEDDAARIVNSTPYGLTGGVYAGDAERALAFAKRMRTGQVDINRGRFNPIAPFGGYGQSGNGRELGRYGIEEFLETKSIQR